MASVAPHVLVAWQKLSPAAREALRGGNATPAVVKELKTLSGGVAQAAALRQVLLEQAGALDDALRKAGANVDAGKVVVTHKRVRVTGNTVFGARLPPPAPEKVLEDLVGRPMGGVAAALAKALASVKPGDAGAAAAGVRDVERALHSAMGMSSRRASVLLTSLLALPRVDRAQLGELASTPEQLHARPLNEVVQATLNNALSMLASGAGMDADALAVHLVMSGAAAPAPLQSAAAQQLGAQTGQPRLVDDSRFAAKVEVPFEQGVMLLSTSGALHSIRRADGAVIPGDLLGDPPRAVLKLARNLGGGGVVLDGDTLARGAALLKESWMAKEGLLDPADAFVVGLTPKDGEPARFLYRMKEGSAWRPVPDAQHPVSYFGADFLGDDGAVLPKEKLPAWAASFHERMGDLKAVADPHVLGMTGPGESLPVTHTHGAPQTRDFMITTRSGAHTHLGLLIRRGDTGAYATAGGFVDKAELEAIQKAKAAWDAAPPEKKDAAYGAWMRAMFAAALRELMEEAFGKAKKNDPAIIALRQAFDDAVAHMHESGALQLVAEGPVNGDFRRTAYGGMETRFVTLEIDPALYRALEQLAQGTDDAKFAGSIAIVEQGRVGRHINGHEMPFHHGMVEELARQRLRGRPRRVTSRPIT